MPWTVVSSSDLDRQAAYLSAEIERVRKELQRERASAWEAKGETERLASLERAGPESSEHDVESKVRVVLAEYGPRKPRKPKSAREVREAFHRGVLDLGDAHAAEAAPDIILSAIPTPTSVLSVEQIRRKLFPHALKGDST